MSEQITLTTYFRSTAAYRVRIALNHKGIDHTLLPVNLLTGEHKEDSFLAHNPQGLLPTLKIDVAVVTQSMAILEYIEETYPQSALLPDDGLQRAAVRSLAHSIACDIHPLNNLRVLKYLVNEVNVDESGKLKWYHHWLELGFSAIEKQLAHNADRENFCFGSSVTMADVCLIPQVYNANRFNFDLSNYPLISEVNEHCLQLPAFAKSAPEHQPDFKS